MVNGTGFFNVPVALCCEAGAIFAHRRVSVAEDHHDTSRKLWRC
jgi:hypothetical protein